MYSTCVVVMFGLMAGAACQDLGYQSAWEEDQNQKYHLCGRNLNEALRLVCKGVYNGYDKKSLYFSNAKNFENSPQDQSVNNGNKWGFSSEDDTDNVFNRNSHHPRFRRTIVYECCVRKCSYRDLKGYCMN